MIALRRDGDQEKAKNYLERCIAGAATAAAEHSQQATSCCLGCELLEKAYPSELKTNLFNRARNQEPQSPDHVSFVFWQFKFWD